MRWYWIYANGLLIGKLQSTEAEIREHLGPYLSIDTQSGEVRVYGRPAAH